MKHVTPSKPEILAPVGNFEKLEIAVHYGADAVYLSGKDFSLRNFSDNFTLDEMRQAISFAHENGVKVYVACNVYSRNHEQAAIAEFMASLENMDPAAGAHTPQHPGQHHELQRRPFLGISGRQKSQRCKGADPAGDSSDR